MLGWEFIIRGKKNQLIASWLVGLEGFRWIEDLVSKGLAKQTETNQGYPEKYEIRAEVLLTALSDVVPMDDTPIKFGDWIIPPRGYNKFDFEALRSLPPDEILTVEAWDQD